MESLGGYQDYDPDQHFDSSSSGSSDNHSSPAYSASSQQDWALDLGLAMPWSPSHTPLDPTAFAAQVKLAPRATSPNPAIAPSPRQQASAPQHPHQLAPDQHDTRYSLAPDFWTASPGAHSASGANGEREGGAGEGDYFGAQGKESADRSMEFDDMVHEGVCGPSLVAGSSNHSSAVPTPRAALPPSASSSQPATMTPAAFSHVVVPSAASHAFMQRHASPPRSDPPPPSLAMTLDSLSGIAPALTSGLNGSYSDSPVPSVESSAAEEQQRAPSPSSFGMSTRRSASSARPSLDGSMVDAPYARSSSSRASSRARTSREPSLSRSSAAPPALPSSIAPHQLPALPPSSAFSSSTATKPPGTTVNLVARDAIQAAELIPSLSAPAPESLFPLSSSSSSSPIPPPAKLLVLGVPTVGAKSRVETQIKISLALVRPLPGLPPSLVESEEYLAEDGGLSLRAGGELERLGSWTHLRLPKNLALKAKQGKASGAAAAAKKARPDPPAEQCLAVEVAVVSATDGREVSICANCQQRELKRSLRKKDPKGKTFTAPLPPVDPSAPPRDEVEEGKKVVVFNAPEYVEFGTGECVVPTRVTCYCRHHKEKRGFRVTYALRDHLGNLVATGQTPPVMITDDHKTSSTKPSAPSSVAGESIPSSAAPSPAMTGTKRKAAASAPAKPKKEKAPSPPASSALSAAVSTSGRPRRSNAGRARRGQTESDDEPGAAKKARPYDAETRPLRTKRTSAAQQQRSPTFGMTPLPAMVAPMQEMQQPPAMQQLQLVQHQQHQQPKPVSPVVSIVGLPGPGDASRTPSAAASPANSFSLALGLGGMDDAVMNSADGLVSGMATPSSAYLPFGRSGSIDPTQTSFDFRSSVSTPPLSPGSTTASAADTFHSLFSGFPSPQPSLLEPGPAPPSQQPQQLGQFPSFAIPATEELPTSLTPSWSLLQQQLQQSEPAAPPPRINRIIPGEGPVQGGTEVTVLGENFVRDLICVFGDSPAVPTHFWSSNTLVCVLPPSANPGPVVVSIKGVPLTVEQGNGLQLFTYKDDSDRSLLELALQVVGLKMTGRLEHASAIAMRIVGNSPTGGAGAGGAGVGPAPGGAPTDTATLAATLNAAASSVYATPAASRASSRRSSLSGPGSPTGSAVALPADIAAAGETRNFQDIVIKFLSLLDLDPSLIPGAAPSLPSVRPPISQPNAQQHTLLHLATVLGFHRLVAFLLARDIALDAPDRNGFTALHFAALHGRVAIARLLLDAGARVGVRNLAGKSPLEIAQERDDVDVEELLLARGAANATPTVSTLGRRQLVAFEEPPTPPAERRRASIVSFEESESEEDWSDEDPQERELVDDEYSSEWSGSESEEVEWDSEYSTEEDEEEEDDDEDAQSAHESGEEADESALEGAPVRPRSRPLSRNPSRNASTVSLQHLVDAEREEVKRMSPRSKRAALPLTDDVPAATPSSAAPTPLNHLASASSAWIQQKLKPTVQPFADNVADAFSQAAHRFTLPEIPAALTRRMSRHSRRSSRRSADEHSDEDAGAASERSTGSSFSKDVWRAPFSGAHWWGKTPSSPPPQYTPTDSLAVAPEKTAVETATETEQEGADQLASPSSSTSSPSSSRISAAPTTFRSKLRRRASATSYTSEDTDGEAFSGEQGKLIGFSGDRMLLMFWLPVLLFVLVFAYSNWQQYAQPVVDTLADTILPRSIARLLT